MHSTCFVLDPALAWCVAGVCPPPTALLLVMPDAPRDLPREVQLAAEMLARRARRLAAAGALGPNQLAYCLRGAALLAPRWDIPAVAADATSAHILHDGAG
jgi:hypothetical protein